ncbi:DUF2169 family type VI secretion system accessory protein [Xenorhabdus szentirmaii]|uniref:DUF2169 family type VI secretion system accessory protein n=1 Tax=Xenorhabdus szentirmaii TaxID=290112 RepID=UPI000C04A15E|nr:MULTISPECIES: DUF2169 domain-containing protein [Xenorhabdus]MBD2794108.1 DUF2169 domain-containing protein [Xenorhabdus sp. CUL]MBD2806867.1 DUF2169 domain-containing protein [Xenorhabdus sp. ZM]PHM44483.1 hypothetical protein Xszus_04319 [Xenorhabdus szentirmaii]
MEFKNLTPFSVMHYKMLDTEDEEYHVVAMKIVYQLQPIGDGPYYQAVLTEPFGELALQDEFSGDLNQSSVLQESDLAPLKPKCDVIVNGVAYAQGSIPAERVPIRLLVTTADRQPLIDKTLLVWGEREFQRTSEDEWQLTSPQKFTALPIDYQYAFGGQCKIYDDDETAAAVADELRLSAEQREQHPEKDAPPIAHATFEYNPIGTGFVTPWYAEAKALSRYPAPRIEYPDAPITGENFSYNTEPPTPITDPSCQPAGFGIIGRPWLPRRTKAGTYDETWLEERHPYLPDDFDFGYWNNAPEDQQIDHPDNNIRISLFHLTREGILRVQLPGHRPFMLLRMMNGEMIPDLMYLDTLIIDSEALTLSMTYRYHAEIDESIRLMEARFEMNPNAPLVRIDMGDGKELHYG